MSFQSLASRWLSILGGRNRGRHARSMPLRCGKNTRRESKIPPEIGLPSIVTLLGEMPATGRTKASRFFLSLYACSGWREIDLRGGSRRADSDVPEYCCPSSACSHPRSRHEHAGARIERVDDHLAIDRAGDLHPAILDVVGDRLRRSAPRGYFASRSRSQGACRRRMLSGVLRAGRAARRGGCRICVGAGPRTRLRPATGFPRNPGQCGR